MSRLGLSAAALLATALPLVARATPPAWRATAAGLEVRVLTPGPGREQDPWVLLVRADPRRHELRVVAAPRAELAVDVVAAETGALAAINGGFFDPGGAPMGWVVSDGRETSRLRAAGWGAFVVPEKGPARIVSARAARGLRPRQAVQAGPRLVVGGQVQRLKPQSARRAFVGLDARGRVVVGCTGPFAADATALARLLARDEADGGAGLRDALALDGGSSAQLFVRDADGPGADLLLPGLARVPNAIVVLPASGQPPSR